MAYKTPGVYQEEIFLQSEASLPTGIPGFVGFFTAKPAEDEPAANSPLSLSRKQEFTDKFISLSESYLAEAITGFFENGGTRCYVVRADSSQDWETALKQAIIALAPLEDLDLVTIPDAMMLRLPNQQPDRAAIIRVQQAVLEHCAAHGDRLAILDALPGSTAESVILQRHQLIAQQKQPLNGTLYYPWLRNIAGRLVPPCGHVAGIFAHSDRTRGVFKAPANQEIHDVLDLEISIDNGIQDQLNPEGINCLRAFPGRGIRIWGARTLNQDTDWRYVNIRRLFLTLGRWIDRNLLWATLEPNSPRLWVRIQRELSIYLTQLWQAGALQGSIPEQAFYVKCDAETNAPESREVGQVVTEIGLAMSAPAEFLVVRIIHRAGTPSIT
jgi:hypothetical protein